jgi:2'-5' RNA ligase
MARLFVAVVPPDDVLEQVAALPRPEREGLRWTGREQWHVTLRFLGRVDDVAAVAAALDETALPVAAAVLGPAVGRFGHRILHVPVAGLDALAATVVTATAGIGQPPEDRPFAGHLTLARVGKGRAIDLRPLAGQFVSGRWPVADVCLFESHLHPGGARHEVLQRFPLDRGGQGLRASVE